MARKAKTTPPSPKRSASLRAVVGLAVAVVIVIGLMGLRRGLLAQATYADVKARVMLASAPRWLPADMARSILADVEAAAEGRGVFEPDLAKDVYAAAAANVWVSKVVRVTKRSDGRVLVEAEFRRPYVIVQVPRGRPVVVDRDAVVLPLPLARLTANSLIIIGGVATSPPADGTRWDADDLADGLRLVKLIESRPYVREITLIDVRNHRRRVSQQDPELAMVAQVGRGSRTVIRFGRFPHEEIGDYCVSPDQKLKYLDAYYRRNGDRLAGRHSFIELRYDDPYASLR